MELKHQPDQPVTPWGMPEDIYNDLTEGAAARRAEWVVKSESSVSAEIVAERFGLDGQEVDQLKLNVKE